MEEAMDHFDRKIRRMIFRLIMLVGFICRDRVSYDEWVAHIHTRGAGYKVGHVGGHAGENRSRRLRSKASPWFAMAQWFCMFIFSLLRKLKNISFTPAPKVSCRHWSFFAVFFGHNLFFLFRYPEVAAKSVR
jgi:hypothetical protein